MDNGIKGWLKEPMWPSATQAHSSDLSRLYIVPALFLS